MNTVNEFSGSVAAALLLILLGCAPLQRTPPPDLSSPPVDATSETERRLFEQINRQRVDNDLEQLAWNGEVADVARSHAQRMAELGFFDHEDPDHGSPADRLRAAGVGFTRAGENLFQELGHPDPVTIAVDGWMASPGHRSNIVDPDFTQSGLAIHTGKNNMNYFVQIFIRPAGDSFS